MKNIKLIKNKIRSVKNWPKKGVIFRDITSALEDKKIFQSLIIELAKLCPKTKIDKVVGIDARGFILASALAFKLKTGLAIARKKGKLPSKIISQKYSLEYSSETLQMHKNAIKKRETVLLVDDVLATGGTMQAAVKIVKKLNGKIAGIIFFIELPALKGREKLKNYPVKSLIKF